MSGNACMVLTGSEAVGGGEGREKKGRRCVCVYLIYIPRASRLIISYITVHLNGMVMGDPI